VNNSNITENGEARKEKWIKCPECGIEMPASYLMTAVDGTKMCPGCIDSYQPSRYDIHRHDRDYHGFSEDSSITENGELETEKESVENFAKKFGLKSDTKDGNTIFTDGEKWVIVDEQKDGYHVSNSENDEEEIVTGPSEINNIISRVFTKKVAENTVEKKTTKPTKDIMSPAENSFLDYATRGIGKLL
jgi:hypothetical protein